MNNLHKYFIILLIIGGLISIGYFVYLRLNSENLNSETMIIDNLTPEKNQQWVFFTDRVMGGVSSGKLEIGSEDGSKFYRMTGNVSTANNGGFIQFQADLSNISNTEEVFNGIKIKVRGNNENYQIFIRTNLTVLPWQYYSSEFYASNQWKEIKLPSGDHRPESSKSDPDVTGILSPLERLTTNMSISPVLSISGS